MNRGRLVIDFSDREISMSSELISTFISSLVPILITLFFAWISNRNERSQRKNVLEDVKSRIDLINEYVAAQSLVINDPERLGEIKKTAANELYDIKTFLDNKLQSLEKTSKRSSEPLQHFFLIYKMNTIRARFFRVVFFITLLFSVLWSTILFAFGTNNTNTLVEDYIFEIIAILPAILIALFFRWQAIKSDKPLNPT
jgi:hypothetical protein